MGILLFFTFVFSLILTYYLNIHIYLQENIYSILNNSLPFRESYDITFLGIIYTYLLPVLTGFLIGRVFYSPKIKSNAIYYLNLSLLFSLIINLPLLFLNKNLLADYWFNNHILIYNFILFPFLFLLGCLPYLKNSFSTESSPSVYEPKIKRWDFAIGFMFAVIVFILNLVPAILSRYFVGADIYYHAALSRNISSFDSIFHSPFFLEDKNFYYSIVYFLISGFSSLTKLSIQTTWYLAVASCGAIFISFFYWFARRISGSSLKSAIATLFILPLNQILWVDPSIRIFSYAFFSLFIFNFQSFIYQKKPLSFILCLILFILIVTSHPEIALHVFIIIFVFLALSFKKLNQIFINLINFGSTALRRLIAKDFGGFHLNSLESNNNTVVLIGLYLLGIFPIYFLVFAQYPLGKMLIFNEIPLSIFQPIGIVSFLVFITLPFGFIRIIKNKDLNSRLLLSVAFLFTSIGFYFTYLWAFYHRYFAETAYYAFAIISAMIWGDFIKKLLPFYRLVFILLIFGFVFMSFLPKYLFEVNYATATNDSIGQRMEEINFIKTNTDPKSVIFLPPDNILNRYLPFYGDRFIFAANSVINKERQWQVLSFCNGPYSENCLRRLNFSDDFFQNPSIEKLNTIKQSYRLDYIYLDKVNYLPLVNLLNNDLRLNVVNQNLYYIIFDIRGEQL